MEVLQSSYMISFILYGIELSSIYTIQVTLHSQSPSWPKLSERQYEQGDNI